MSAWPSAASARRCLGRQVGRQREFLLALCQWDEFRLHVRAALTEGGFTPDDIKEIVLQQAIYCGVPAANHAVKEASAVLQELGLLKG
jgi:hypothetical protein